MLIQGPSAGAPHYGAHSEMTHTVSCLPKSPLRQSEFLFALSFSQASLWMGNSLNCLIFNNKELFGEGTLV